MKPPGAPEVPMDARKRKGLIGTKVRGEILQGPGARCVVQIFEKRPESKCAFGTNKATKYDPEPSDHFDRHGLEQKNALGSSGGVQTGFNFSALGTPWERTSR